MSKAKSDNNLRKDFSKEIRTLVKKLKREENTKAAEDARAQTATTAETSKVRRTLESKMKKPKKKKNPAEELESDSKTDKDYINFLRAGGWHTEQY